MHGIIDLIIWTRIQHKIVQEVKNCKIYAFYNKCDLKMLHHRAVTDLNKVIESRERH